jgi:hypothetical protein
MKSRSRSIEVVLALALSVLALAQPLSAAPLPGKFAGVPVVAGGITQAYVPLTPLERQYAGEGGNVVPPQAVAVLAVPQNFDPTRAWPVLVPLATDDFKRKNRDDLKDFYRPDAIAEGWIVLAGDGVKFPGHGTSGWRAGMTLAALDALHRSFPGSKDWPVAVAGFSGGAKQTGLLAPLFSVAGTRIIGLFLSGINVDKLSLGYRSYPPGRKFLHTPVFISSGLRDTIATPLEQREVKLSIEKTGFDRVRLENFQEGHAVKRTHIHAALRWFRQLAGL